MPYIVKLLDKDKNILGSLAFDSEYDAETYGNIMLQNPKVEIYATEYIHSANITDIVFFVAGLYDRKTEAVTVLDIDPIQNKYNVVDPPVRDFKNSVKFKYNAPCEFTMQLCILDIKKEGLHALIRRKIREIASNQDDQKKGNYLSVHGQYYTKDDRIVIDRIKGIDYPAKPFFDDSRYEEILFEIAKLRAIYSGQNEFDALRDEIKDLLGADKED